MKIRTIPTPSEQTDLIMEILQFRRTGQTAREAKATTSLIQRFWPFHESVTVSFLSRNNVWDLLAKDDALSVSKIAFMAAVNKWDPSFGKEPSRLISQYVIGYLKTAITKSDAYLMRITRTTAYYANAYFRWCGSGRFNPSRYPILP